MDVESLRRKVKGYVFSERQIDRKKERQRQRSLLGMKDGGEDIQEQRKQERQRKIEVTVKMGEMEEQARGERERLY